MDRRDSIRKTIDSEALAALICFGGSLTAFVYGAVRIVLYQGTVDMPGMPPSADRNAKFCMRSTNNSNILSAVVILSMFLDERATSTTHQRVAKS